MRGPGARLRRLALGLALALPATAALAAPALPRLAIDPQGVTVSGVSSGGYMATQFQLAHGDLVQGAGVFAAGPWNCAQGSMRTALGECFDDARARPDARALVAQARAAARAGRLAPPESWAEDRVWLFRGSADDKVAEPVFAALVEFYRALVPAERLAVVTDVPAGHGVPTRAAGVACAETAAPYLNACDYDGAGRLLAHLYGPLAAPAPAGGRLEAFDQRGYDAAGALATTGWVYVPTECARGVRCRLHVAFHGCRQGQDFVGEAFVRESGYNGWAESNRIVVLYPQVRRSWFLPLNPQGCWDWWGYTGAGYATREGAQVRAVRAMVRALAGR